MARPSSASAPEKTWVGPDFDIYSWVDMRWALLIKWVVGCPFHLSPLDRVSIVLEFRRFWYCYFWLYEWVNWVQVFWWLIESKKSHQSIWFRKHTSENIFNKKILNIYYFNFPSLKLFSLFREFFWKLLMTKIIL